MSAKRASTTVYWLVCWLILKVLRTIRGVMQASFDCNKFFYNILHLCNALCKTM